MFERVFPEDVYLGNEKMATTLFFGLQIKGVKFVQNIR